MLAAASRVFLSCALLALPLAVAADPAVHQGVATCASATCHGATSAFTDAHIRQDEYFIWQRKDRHANAYNTLLNQRSRGIAAKLGIADAAQSATCLSCHSDFVPQPERGERFLLTDGVGCEACHGGAQNWLATHTRGYTDSAARKTAGLFPLWEPEQRAGLCLSCHQGDDGARRMTHAIMAAGHPPLLFELDTFTQLQPPHFDADADYAKRKGAPDAASNWLAGQMQAASLYLDQLAVAANRGVFPELALFECNACHRSMHSERASAQRSGGQAPGTPPLADASLLMLMHWLEAAAHPAAQQWHSGWRDLHRAVASGDLAQLRASAKRLHQGLDRQLRSSSAITPAQSRRLLLLLCSENLQHLDGDFSHAEQTAMAIAVLSAALQQEGGAANPALRAAINRLYATVEHRDRFSPAQYRAALDALRARLN